MSKHTNLIESLNANINLALETLNKAVRLAADNDEASKAEIASLNAELSSCKDENKRLESCIKDADDRIDVLSSGVHELNEQKLVMKKRYNDLVHDGEELSSAYQKYKAKYNRVKAKLDEHVKTSKRNCINASIQLHSSIKLMQDKIVNLENLVRSQDVLIDDRDREITNLKEERDTILRDSQEQVKSYEKRIYELEVQLAVSTPLPDEAQLTKYEYALHAANVENALLTEKIRKMQKCIVNVMNKYIHMA